MIRISFYGGVEDVTGSCFLLETSTARVIIDCGMHQGERLCSTKNLEPFGFEPSHVHAVVVTHAHFDHTGRLPDLVKRGYSGKIYMTPPTKALSDIVLADAVHVMAENAKKCGDPALYDAPAVPEMLEHVVTVPYHHQTPIAEGVTVEFFDAGHILGSAHVRVTMQDGNEKKTFVFSGDIGNDDVPILPSTEPRADADVVICESTYGHKTHETIVLREERLAAFLKKILGRGGTVLIPAFSVERTQELLFAFDQLSQRGDIPNVPIYLDSPLAIRATQVYRHFSEYLSFHGSVRPGADDDWFRFPSLIETPSVDASKLINDDRRPKVILAGNGMMTGGRIIHHLARYISDDRAGILIVGFQAQHTLGRKIQSGAQAVTLFGEPYDVRATVETIEAFSAHGDQKKLTWFVRGNVLPKRVFLVHGELESKEGFAEHLRATLHANVEIPGAHQTYEIE